MAGLALRFLRREKPLLLFSSMAMPYSGNVCEYCITYGGGGARHWNLCLLENYVIRPSRAPGRCRGLLTDLKKFSSRASPRHVSDFEISASHGIGLSAT